MIRRTRLDDARVSQTLGGLAGRMRSLQRGLETGGGGTLNETITSVELGQARLDYLQSEISAGSEDSYYNKARLSTATNIEFVVGVANTRTVSWEVEERWP